MCVVGSFLLVVHCFLGWEGGKVSHFDNGLKVSATCETNDIAHRMFSTKYKEQYIITTVITFPTISFSQTLEKEMHI